MNYAYNYFQRKMLQWGATPQSRKEYIQSKGRIGLKEEFEQDTEFKTTVCPLIHQIGDLQLKDELVKNLEDFVDEWFGSPVFGEVNIVVGAIADACGYTTTGKKLIISGLVALIPFVAAILLGSRK